MTDTVTDLTLGSTTKGGYNGDRTDEFTDGTNVLVIVLASVISALVVGGLIALACMMKRSRSEPLDARDLYPQQPPGRFMRRGNPEAFREYRAQQSMEQNLTEHAQAMDMHHNQDELMEKSTTKTCPSSSATPSP